MKSTKVLTLVAIVAITSIATSTSIRAAVVYTNSFEVADGYPDPGGSFTTGGTGMAGTVALYDEGNYFNPATNGSQYLAFNYSSFGSGGSFTSPNISTITGGGYVLKFDYGMFNNP